MTAALLGCSGPTAPHQHYTTAAAVFTQCVPALLESQGAVLFRDPVVPSVFFLSWGTGPLAGTKAKASQDDTGFDLTFLEAGSPERSAAETAWLAGVEGQVRTCEAHKNQ